MAARGALRVVLAALASGILTLAASVPAQARINYVKVGEFGGKGTTEGLFSNPQRVAVDPSTGDIFVVDTPNHRVQVFDPTATSAQYLTKFGETELSKPVGIAVDPTTGAVYVTDPGLNQIVKYDQVPGAPPTFAKDPTFTSPVQGSSDGQIGSFGETNGFYGSVFGGIAVDPTVDSATGTHDILVADTASKLIERFTSGGTWVSSFNGFNFKIGEPFVASFEKPADLTVNSAGDIIVADIRSESEVQIRRYNAAGEWKATLQATEPPGPVPNEALNFKGVVIGADAGTSQVFVSSKSSGSPAGEIYRFSGPASTPPDAEIDHFGCGSGCEGFNGIFGGIAALPASATAHARLYVMATNVPFLFSGPVPKIQVFEGLVLPDVTTGQASSVTTTSATLTGSVNPDGVTITDCHFEYVDTAGYEPSATDPYSAGKTAACASTPSGSSAEAVSAAVSNLTPGTVYHFRLVAANANGSSVGADQKLATGASIDSQSPSDVGSTYATLHAQINPNGTATEYRFEYDTSEYATGEAPHGTSVPIPDEVIGAGEADVPVSQTISGLEADATYHWRTVAIGPAGTVYGLDQTLATYPPPPAALPDSRAYELVTPPSTGGNSLGQTSLPDFQASVSVDGEHVLYNSTESFADATSGLGGVYVASRTRSGWLTTAASLPVGTPHPKAANLTPAPQAATPDYSTLLLQTPNPIDPNDQNGVEDVYSLHLPERSAAWISQNGTVLTSRFDRLYVGASADLRHVIFTTREKLTPNDSAQVAGFALYERFDGRTSLVGVKTDGSPISACGASLGDVLFYGTGPEAAPGVNPQETEESPLAPGANAVSRTGSRVFFESPNPEGVGDPSCSNTSLGGERSIQAGGGTLPVELYVRENGASTTEISLSQRTGEVGTPAPHGATFRGATSDGSLVFFSSSDQLTDDAPAATGGERDLYRYDVEGRTLSFLASAHEGRIFTDREGDPMISADGSRFYFIAEIAGKGPAGLNLYLWDHGTIYYVSAKPTAGGSRQVDAQISTDGSSIAFTAEDLLGSGPGQTQIYLYREANGAPVCVSCDPNGISPSGNAAFFGEGTGAPNQISRNLSADGERLFFDSPDPLLPQATNGLYNVYEWEADGTGSCHDDRRSGGCLYLISGGDSSKDSLLVGASDDGRDAIFATVDRLTLQDEDKGNYSFYDARAGGGFPAPPTSVPCSGDGCRAASTGQALSIQPLGSVAFSGPGNLPAQSRPAGTRAAKPPTRAQKLARALKACHRKKNRRKRAACDRNAKKRYAAKKARNAKTDRRASR